MTYTPRIIDCHLHMVGNGSGGSGCTLKLHGHHRVLAWIMLRSLGLPLSLIDGPLEERYIARVLEMIDGSAVDAAVLLAHERTRDERGLPLDFGSLYVPNDVVLDLAARHPQLLAGVSIHPARPDAMEELERCIARGASLMKCLPNCQNFNPSDPRFTKFWERMAEARLPFLCHTGGELSLPVYRHAYADPKLLELPLSVGVTVIAAHSGTSSHYFDPSYIDDFGRMLGRFPNLYGDNSALMTPLRSRHIPRLLEEPFRSRMIYGSDIPIPISGLWPRIRRITPWSSRSFDKLPNMLERDYRIKVAMGFPAESFTRLSGLLP